MMQPGWYSGPTILKILVMHDSALYYHIRYQGIIKYKGLCRCSGIFTDSDQQLIIKIYKSEAYLITLHQNPASKQHKDL
jgi:hypothetical protein